jgi:hypothetical protein
MSKGDRMAGSSNGTSVVPEPRTGQEIGGEGRCALRDAWALRNATAEAMLMAEGHMRRLIEGADIAELIALVEAFAPSRSPGPEWTRSFEPLVERLWAWCDDERMAALAAEFQERGVPWMAVTNAFAPERGAELRARLRQPAWARFPSFTIA